MLGVAALAQLALAEFPQQFIPVSVKRAGQDYGRGRRRYIERIKHDPWKTNLGKENWKELRALLQAEEDAIAAAESQKNEAARQAMEDAAEEAAKIVEQLEADATASLDRIRGLTKALQAVATAKAAATAIKRANAACEYALALQAHMREMEDEDESIVLLLS